MGDEPKSIQRLDPVVVNRIAAGEIIRRPANALKEMIENSLDAKATNLHITVKNGGLKFLQIKDNGTGIKKEDLEIVCERFTTSKLKNFEDLQSIETYGFRGEALASISHVAHLTIQTKTAKDQCANKASYEDGRLKGAIKTLAGNQGTLITVEDLFYNVPQRKQFFKSPSEEFQKITDVVSKYAIHNANVGFSLTKSGENVTLRTPINSSKLANIRSVYGADVANALIPITCDDKRYRFKMSALVTNVKYSSKKFTFLLFINHRLVESTAVRTAIDQVFASFLPKGNHPFVYMDLQLEANNVDVNVHPTKHEVNFLYESEIVGRIKDAFEAKLVGSNETREIYTQQLLPGASDPISEDEKALSQGKEAKVYAKDIIRSDAKEQKLEKFFGQTYTKGSQRDSIKSETVATTDEENSEKDSSSQKLPIVWPIRIVESERKQTKLTSVLMLRKRVENRCNAELRRILAESIFVGCVNRRLSLIQFESGLYLCDMQKLSEELFYQILLYDFENFGKIQLEPRLSVKELAVIALNQKESGWCELDGPIDELAENVENILLQKSPILREYYGFVISDDGFIEALPLLLDNHIPALSYLPIYILRLATEVDWQKEKQCFDTFSRETATFYAKVLQSSDDAEWKWTAEHVLYDNMKRYLIPSSAFDKCILQTANLQNLYKVFERC